MTRIIAILALVCLCLGQQYLPKERGYLPVNDIYMADVARSGNTDFWKVDGNYWTTVTSAYPVRPNAVTKVSFQLISGNQFFIGCGKGPIKDALRFRYVGSIPETLSLEVHSGEKYNYEASRIDYSSPAVQGDIITMTIDMRPYKNSLSFAKNGLPMGIAFSGLNSLGDVYIMFSLHWIGNRLKITDYEVEE
jgi:hypothetical protein